MKKIIVIIMMLICAVSINAQSFVSPINFVENDINKEKVILFIKKQVKDDYTAIGMNDPSILRMMEEENLKSFKELTKVSNKTLLQSVIKTYCEIGLCNYSTILMMYNEQEKSSKQKLEW